MTIRNGWYKLYTMHTYTHNKNIPFPFNRVYDDDKDMQLIGSQNNNLKCLVHIRLPSSLSTSSSMYLMMMIVVVIRNIVHSFLFIKYSDLILKNIFIKTKTIQSVLIFDCNHFFEILPTIFRYGKFFIDPSDLQVQQTWSLLICIACFEFHFFYHHYYYYHYFCCYCWSLGSLVYFFSIQENCSLFYECYIVNGKKRKTTNFFCIIKNNRYVHHDCYKYWIEHSKHVTNHMITYPSMRVSHLYKQLFFFSLFYSQ